MASLWARLRQAIRGSVSGVHWVEPGNEITRAVLGSRAPARLPDGPLYERDQRDLIFTIDQLLRPSWLASEPREAGAVPPASPKKQAPRRRAGRAA